MNGCTSKTFLNEVYIHCAPVINAICDILFYSYAKCCYYLCPCPQGRGIKHCCPSVTPWFNAECRDARRHARAAERRYRHTCSDVDKRTWLDKLKAMRALYEDVNSNYWRSEIAASSGDTQRLANIQWCAGRSDC